MLLDPFEEEFHLPAAIVESGNAQGGQGEVVGQEDQTRFLFGVEETDPPQFVGKILGSIETFWENRSNKTPMVFSTGAE